MWLCWLKFCLNSILRGSFPPCRRELSIVLTFTSGGKRVFLNEKFLVYRFTGQSIADWIWSKSLQKYYNIIIDIIISKYFNLLNIISVGVVMNKDRLFIISELYPIVYIQWILHIFSKRVVHTGLLHFDLQAMR